MNKKYTDIKKSLQIEINSKSDNRLAHLTHYLQNHKNGVSQYYKPNALQYLKELHEELNITQEPDFQYYLPIQWDIPFCYNLFFVSQKRISTVNLNSKLAT